MSALRDLELKEKTDMKKKIGEQELENVSGGALAPSYDLKCKRCGKVFNMIMYSESRTVEDGCSNKIEYKCPHCGAWF